MTVRVAEVTRSPSIVTMSSAPTNVVVCSLPTCVSHTLVHRGAP